MDFYQFPRENCFEQLMVKILKTQTALQSVKMTCMDDLFDKTPLPMVEVRNVLMYGKTLSEFVCQVILLEVNSESYESVLCLVKNRIRTKIISANKRSNCIPDDVLAKSENECEWLDVRYTLTNYTSYN